MQRTSLIERTLGVLVVLIIITMPTQWSIDVPMGGWSAVGAGRATAMRIAVADGFLAVAFALWVVWRLFGSDRTTTTWPPLAAFFLVALAFYSVFQAASRTAALREAVQFVEYFLVAFLIFANCIRSREQCRSCLHVFVLVTSAIVVYAFVQYLAADNAMAVCGPFGNRNVLGSYLAISLPVVFALGLYEKRRFLRAAMMLVVLIGCVVTLSGGALIAILLGLLLVAAIHSRRLLLATVVVAVLCLALLPPIVRHIGGWAPKHHLKILSESLAIQNTASHLVNPERTIEQAKALLEKTPPRLHRAAMLLNTVPVHALLDRPDVLALMARVKGDLSQSEQYALAVPDVTARYKAWQAAANTLESRFRKDQPVWLRGVGGGNYQDAVNQHYGRGAMEKPDGPDGFPQFYNLYFDEPDTQNQFLLLAVELGTLGLFAYLWWIGLFVGNAVRGLGTTSEDRDVALGVLGGLVGCLVCAVFSPHLIRGVALPLVFLVSILTLTLRSEP